MTFTSRALAVTATALTVVLTGPALSAHAAGNHWKTLVPFDGAKLQACKVATTDTGPWKIKLRVDASRARARVEGSAYAVKGQKNVDKWRSGWVDKGHISAVGTVKLPQGKDYSLNAGVGGGQSGDGGSFTASQVPHC